jgi:ABC-2 type transport system ATP-binding protein
VIETAPHPVEIEGLRTHCGEAAGLEDITLTVRAGEIFGLLGLRGAGKTTLLKAVLLILEPAAGAVRLFGEGASSPRCTLAARLPAGAFPAAWPPVRP